VSDSIGVGHYGRPDLPARPAGSQPPAQVTAPPAVDVMTTGTAWRSRRNLVSIFGPAPPRGGRADRWVESGSRKNAPAHRGCAAPRSSFALRRARLRSDKLPEGTCSNDQRLHGASTHIRFAARAAAAAREGDSAVLRFGLPESPRGGRGGGAIRRVGAGDRRLVRGGTATAGRAWCHTRRSAASCAMGTEPVRGDGNRREWRTEMLAIGLFGARCSMRPPGIAMRGRSPAPCV
jgi:hypothetical protein